MRKTISLIAILCMAVIVITPAALAAEPYELLPVDVVHNPEQMEIRKIYEMATSVNPDDIPRSVFERDGVLYSCADILREVVIGDEIRTLTETETIDSSKNDIESVMNLLPFSKEVVTDDGFVGTLFLNTSSIHSEVSGYGSKTSPVTITKNYPNLSDADTQYIPKTVTENNKTYTLQDIQWQTDNTYNVDDYEIGNRFTAIATYGGTKTSNYVKGYTVTADYTGEVCRTGVSVVRYTVIFMGTKIEEPEITPSPEPPAQTPEPESELEHEPGEKSGFNWWYAVLPLLGLSAGAGGFYIFQKTKERRNNAENTDYDYAGAYIDDDSSDPGAGGGQ